MLCLYFVKHQKVSYLRGVDIVIQSLRRHPPYRKSSLRLSLVNIICHHVSGEAKVSNLADVGLGHEDVPGGEVTVDHLP